MRNALLILAALSTIARAEHYDVVVYGGTSAGVIAAVQAKKMGKTVVLVGPDKHLGGLSSGGLGWTDTGNKAVIGGLARDFYHRIYLEYQKDETWKWQKKSEYGNKGQGTAAMDGENRTMWIFEPSVAERVFEGLIKEHNIPVFRDQWLDRDKGVVKKDARIESITMLSGQKYTGSMFIDATYEGDLMAAARVPYTVGREPKAQFNETLNGIVAAHSKSHQFEKDVSPYKIPGDKTSGLVPRIHDGDPGKDGDGDKRVQAYCFRMCLTNDPANRVPFARPDGYDPAQYELLKRYIAAGWKWGNIIAKFDPIPNHKTDTNNHGAFSFDNIGMNYDYPDATYERRREIIKEHELYQKGLLYFLANDPGIPEDIRTRMNQWGLPKDEFTDNGHWPHQIYVREARRMLGETIITENHLTRKIPTTRSIGMGSYNMDSHNVQRYVDPRGFARNEGDVQVNPGGPYPIDYGALIPREKDAVNLLVPVACSTTHIAYGSIRMEPVFMILGQSATTAAILALDAGIPVQKLPYDTLKTRLEKDGQILEYTRPPGASIKPPSLKLDGILIDDTAAEKLGNWASGTLNGTQRIGDGYLHDSNEAKGQKTIRWTIPIKTPATYEIHLHYPPNPNRATNVPICILGPGIDKTIKVNQQNKEASAHLGTFPLKTNDNLTITIDTKDTDGHVVADGVQLIAK
ncbi:MAG: Xanthan lyase precursor [Verrucomicrobiota bacterium]